MQVANTRVSLILALKNDKNSERWEECAIQQSPHRSVRHLALDGGKGIVL